MQRMAHPYFFSTPNISYSKTENQWYYSSWLIIGITA